MKVGTRTLGNIAIAERSVSSFCWAQRTFFCGGLLLFCFFQSSMKKVNNKGHNDNLTTTLLTLAQTAGVSLKNQS